MASIEDQIIRAARQVEKELAGTEGTCSLCANQGAVGSDLGIRFHLEYVTRERPLVTLRLFCLEVRACEARRRS